MRTPLRIQYVKSTNEVTKLSFWKGLKTVLNNFKLFFTQSVVACESAWYETTSDKKIIEDICLELKNGKAEFVKTPDGSEEKNAVLFISQTTE